MADKETAVVVEPTKEELDLVDQAKETAHFILDEVAARLNQLKQIYNSAGQVVGHITQEHLGDMPKAVLDSGLHAMIGTILHGIETYRGTLENLANS